MHLTRMPAIVEKVMRYESDEKIDKVRWKLQSPGDESELNYCHAVGVLNSLLHRFGRFKFGVTHKPAERLNMFKTFRQQVDLFVLVFITEDSDLSAALESRLVKDFRSDDRMLN